MGHGSGAGCCSRTAVGRGKRGLTSGWGDVAAFGGRGKGGRKEMLGALAGCAVCGGPFSAMVVGREALLRSSWVTVSTIRSSARLWGNHVPS